MQSYYIDIMLQCTRLSPRLLWRQFVLAAIACMCPTLVFGGLRWDTKEIALTTSGGDKQAVGVFHFRNSGKTPIIITDVTPTCGCTTAELIKRTYDPGESGEIRAIFTFGDRIGPQEKIVIVRTDDPAAYPVPLIMRVTIPERFTMSPRTLLWQGDEVKAEKPVTISAAAGQRLAKVEIKDVTPGQIRVRLERLETDAKYQLFVVPDPTAVSGTTGTIICVATFSDGTTQRFGLYALVR